MKTINEVRNYAVEALADNEEFMEAIREIIRHSNTLCGFEGETRRLGSISIGGGAEFTKGYNLSPDSVILYFRKKALKYILRFMIDFNIEVFNSNVDKITIPQTEEDLEVNLSKHGFDIQIKFNKTVPNFYGKDNMQSFRIII